MAGNVTVWNATFSESALENPISNTVLRNVLLPKVSKPNARNRLCSADRGYVPRDDMVNYGFPTRIWQRNMLPEALTPSVLRMPIKSDTEIDTNFTQGLPMNASRAANLFVTGVYLVGKFFPWFGSYFAGDAIEPHIPLLADGESVTLSAVDLVGLLPDHEVDEQTQRKWFLERNAT